MILSLRHLSLALVLAPPLLAAANDKPAPGANAAAFPLADVRLLDGPFLHAQRLGHRYLLALDPDRLLAPFRTEAGLAPKAPKYPNWESAGLDGHTAGHYLTAVAQMWAVTGDAELKRRLDTMVADLAECQRASADGFVGGIPRSRQFRDTIAAAAVSGQDPDVKDWWVPWYNEHKLFAGLRDAWLIAGNAQARDVLVRLANWCDALVRPLTDRQLQRMLGSEHGGMNETLADVAALTGDSKYLALARRFSHRSILDPLLRHEDKLTGLHANTQIPKIIGFARVAELGGDASWRDASRFFWETVVTRRSVAFGGNSEREHFNPADDFSAVVESREGPETCNTYNMLRLTEALFRDEPAARYADYYERALFNHILSAQHPEHGGFVYFTPLRPRHYRVYSQPQTCFWCCVGSGMENQGKYGAFIYAHAADTLFVNLFIASELDWRARGVRLRQTTAFPDEPRTQLTIATAQPQRFTLRLRHPAWCAKPRVTVNGAPVALASSPGSCLELVREWRDGDRVDLELPMSTTVERLPDGSDYVALLHGPIVLAAKTGTEQLDDLVAGDARMGHVAPGAHLPMDRAPMLVGDLKRLADSIRPVPGKPLTFSVASLVRPEAFRDLELVPFFRVHDARYMLYWRAVSAADYPRVVAELEATERETLALEARTLDRVAPGEQQPEVEHRLASADSHTGLTLGRHRRDATGWFSYELRTKPDAGPQELLVTYYLRERGRAFDLFVNDRLLASIAPRKELRDRFDTVAYPLPADLLAAAPGGVLTVKFVAKENARTASIFDLRLVKAALPSMQP